MDCRRTVCEEPRPCSPRDVKRRMPIHGSWESKERVAVWITLVLFFGGCQPGEQFEGRETIATEQPVSPATPASPEATWDSAEWSFRITEAEKAMVRLPPAAFTEVPLGVRSQLQAMGCRVPQVHELDEPHNVIKGRFASKDQEDWAALCTLSDSTSILVLWGGPSRCPSPVVASDDRGWFQGVGSGILGYSRKISTSSIATILSYAEEFDGPPPPARDHDGIDHQFFGKASTILFCHEGTWHRLQGID